MLLLLTAQIGLAGSARWLSSPQDSAWENLNNWSAGGPPNGPSDIVTFARSSQREVNISSSVEVNSIGFTSSSDSFTGHAPTDPSESAIIATLPPGRYTAIIRGVNNTTGIALVEVYDLD